jgi:hypothetical protein
MQYRCLPTDEDRASQRTWLEVRLIPLCYDLASVDAGRAERLAATIQNPHLRAYAVGIVAKALAATDKARARKLILRAYDILAEADRSADRRWPRDSWQFSPPAVAAGLLPIAEAIDPTLVGECLWRAVSYRLPRSADDCLVTLQPEQNDAALAALVARYDRKLARALLPAVVKTVISAADRTDYSHYSYYRTTALAMIDVDEALNELRARAAAPGADVDRCLGDAHMLLEMLPVPGPRRWDSYAMNHCGLWNPDNQYQEAGTYSW